MATEYATDEDPGCVCVYVCECVCVWEGRRDAQLLSPQAVEGVS